MIKKILFTLMFSLLLNAHTLIFNALDNEDGTMEIEAMFSTGRSTEGANFKIISIATSQILYEKRIPTSGSLIVDVPKEAYTLLLDSGPGHQLEKNGDIKPKNGFQEVVIKNINFAFYITLILSILFILLAFILQFLKIKKN